MSDNVQKRMYSKFSRTLRDLFWPIQSLASNLEILAFSCRRWRRFSNTTKCINTWRYRKTLKDDLFMPSGWILIICIDIRIPFGIFGNNISSCVLVKNWNFTNTFRHAFLHLWLGFTLRFVHCNGFTLVFDDKETLWQ